MTELTPPDSLLEARSPGEPAYRLLIAYSAACRTLTLGSEAPAELRVALVN